MRHWAHCKWDWVEAGEVFKSIQKYKIIHTPAHAPKRPHVVFIIIITTWHSFSNSNDVFQIQKNYNDTNPINQKNKIRYMCAYIFTSTDSKRQQPEATLPINFFFGIFLLYKFLFLKLFSKLFNIFFLKKE